MSEGGSKQDSRLDLREEEGMGQDQLPPRQGGRKKSSLIILTDREKTWLIDTLGYDPNSLQAPGDDLAQARREAALLDPLQSQLQRKSIQDLVPTFDAHAYANNGNKPRRKSSILSKILRRA